MAETTFPPVGPTHVQDVLRTAGSALLDRPVALFEVAASGDLVPVATTPGRRLSGEAAAECGKLLEHWRVERSEGTRWLGCLLGVGHWCLAPVGPALPRPTGESERRGPERVTLGLAARYLGLLQKIEVEIADARRSEAELRKGALYDGLTGLPNRALFLERVSLALQRAVRESDYRFAVMFLDCDHFKAINDSLGHQSGDLVLVALAKRLETISRPGDLLARLAGDEFALFLEDVGSVSDATHIAERVEAQLDAPFDVQGQEIYVTASVGIALSAAEGAKAEDMLRDADLAMYRAKAQGRARHQVFDPSMRDRARRRLSLAQDLRRAVERQEFRVFYQPILDLRTDRLEGFEALVRWLHPQRGLLQPVEFIGAAEETGLIVPLGSWVLSEACRQARAWQREHPREDPIRMSINLSARQVTEGLVDSVATALLESGLEPRSLRLEITENVLLEGGDEISALLDHLRSLEVQLQLDDFGTGYSSLGYLRRFPLDALKVDRSFVRRLGVRRHDLELVRTIVALAQNLGLGVIAEGVESSSQRDRLLELGCWLGQGFYFAEPLPAADIASRVWT